MNRVLDFSLPKQNLLRSRKDFLRLLKGGKRVKLDSFDIIYSPNDLEYPRLGCIVGKDVSGKAVVSNKIKRLFREFFRHNKDLFGSRDIVFVCKKDISSWTFVMIGDKIRGTVEFK